MFQSEEGSARVSRVLEDNPAYRFLYEALIEYCAEERLLEDALVFCATHRTSHAQILSDAAMVDALVRCGALDRRLLVNGEPYEGSLEGLQADVSVPEDATVAVCLQAADDGLAAARVQSGARSVERLVAEAPQREKGFRAVLAWCSDDSGKTTRQLQELLKEADLLETEEARGIDGLHASYFTGALEAVGALAWNGKAWVANERGRA